MATILALLAFPALFVSAIMMALDLTLGTSFFMPALVSKASKLAYLAGNPLLFQHPVSGSSATPRSTSWRCPPSASCPTDQHPCAQEHSATA